LISKPQQRNVVYGDQHKKMKWINVPEVYIAWSGLANIRNAATSYRDELTTVSVINTLNPDPTPNQNFK